MVGVEVLVRLARTAHNDGWCRMKALHRCHRGSLQGSMEEDPRHEDDGIWPTEAAALEAITAAQRMQDDDTAYAFQVRTVGRAEPSIAARELLDRFFTDAAALGRLDAHAVWNLLTALRGPDLANPQDAQAVKDVTTARVRALVCPDLARVVNCDVAVDEDAAKGVDAAAAARAGRHFEYHAEAAISALYRLGYTPPATPLTDVLNPSGMGNVYRIRHKHRDRTHTGAVVCAGHGIFALVDTSGNRIFDGKEDLTNWVVEKCVGRLAWGPPK